MRDPRPSNRLNWRQILLHFIATCFIAFSFQQFAYLINTEKLKAIEILNNAGETGLDEYLEGKNFTVGEVITYFFYAKSAWLIGLLFAFTLSILIAKRRHWFWVNSLVVLIVVFALGKQHYWDWKYLPSIFLSPGLIFQSTAAYLLTNGIILLSLGLFVFFFKKFNDFIERRQVKILEC